MKNTYFYTAKWSFESDGESWITTFVVELKGDQSVPDAGEAALNHYVAKMYLGEDIIIEKVFFEPVEPGVVSSRKPR
jgi:hypothetical protein